MPRTTKKKVKMMSSKLRHLRRYEKDVEETFEDYHSAWLKDYSEIKRDILGDVTERVGTSSASGESPDFSSAQTPPETGVTEREEDHPPRPDTPPWAKKLYRSVAMATHPDKVEDPSLIPEMTKLFNTAARAIKQGELGDLIDLAVELGMEIDLPASEMARVIRDKIEHAQEKIHSMENCLAWVWCETESDSDKIQIVKQALSHDGVELPSDERLAELIKKLDEIGGEGD